MGVLVLLVGIRSPYVISRPEDIANLEKLVGDRDDAMGIDEIR